MSPETLTRRPIAARNTGWARSIAATLARWRVSPNTISVLSVLSATLAGVFLIWSRDAIAGTKIALFIGAIVFIQGRLLCNLFDGMVAVEGGLKTRSGEIYNELPDRLADTIILVCAGYAAPTCEYSATLGWVAAVAAVFTSYIRALGASAGAGQHFWGPMAKQQRMFLSSLACLAAAFEAHHRAPERVIPITLAIIIVGCVVTAARRTVRIVRTLEDA